MMSTCFQQTTYCYSLYNYICPQLDQCLYMNKRKIEINQLKKIACKGKKIRTINVKYETVFAYFKQKDSKDLNVFQVSFLPIITDMLEQLTATQFIDKLENQCKESLKNVTLVGNSIKFEIFQLKSLSNQYNIKQLCNCLYVEGRQKRVLSIQRAKLMNFFKSLRSIYPDFCYCSGEKVIVESNEIKTLYELFQIQWNKCEQKGRLNASQRLQRKICRSLYFLGILIQNNILDAIQTSQSRKRQQQSECGTRSEQKKNMKVINPQGSTTYTFSSSMDPISTQSQRLKSEASKQEPFSINSNLSLYSKKSEKIVSRSKYDLWDKAQLKQLKFKLKPQPLDTQTEVQSKEINFLSNDVQNLLIEKAFKIEMVFNNPSMFNSHLQKTGQYMEVDYANQNQINYFQQYGNYYMGNYSPYYIEMPYQINYPQQQTYVHQHEYQHSNQPNQLIQLKRSLELKNLVQIRKNVRYQ